MSCQCANIICAEVFYNPCSEGAQLPIVATETGDLSALIEFNSAWTDFSFGAVESEKLIIPSQFLNENYNHEFRLFDTSGDLVNCYYLKSRGLNSAGDFTPIPPTEANAPIKLVITEDGNSFTDARMNGKIVAFIVTGTQSYTDIMFDKPQESDMLTSKLDADNNPLLEFYVGQIIIVNFLNA